MISPEDSDIESLTTMHAFHQSILDPDHLLPNSSLRIYLIFTDQPMLVGHVVLSQ